MSSSILTRAAKHTTHWFEKTLGVIAPPIDHPVGSVHEKKLHTEQQVMISQMPCESIPDHP